MEKVMFTKHAISRHYERVKNEKEFLDCLYYGSISPHKIYFDRYIIQNDNLIISASKYNKEIITIVRRK